ncbi:HNH endonuclease [Kitasatospora sp. NPDC101235]|uniref:HNH endonuclease n=1 Tax=Kitasatospora sp. NPDC101235 TaxID=3364101 RepID=UPI00380C443C
MTSHSANPAPTITEPVLCGGIPVGFGVPLFASIAARTVFARPDGIGQHWRTTPATRRTAAELHATGRRPANLLAPDAFQFAAPIQVEVTNWRNQRESVTVTPVEPLYNVDEAEALGAEPSTARLAADRRSASHWAAEVLADPNTVIMAVSSIGEPPRRTDDPAVALVSCEFTVSDTSGSLLWHQLVNPQWGVLPQVGLAPWGLSADQVADAPRFEEVSPALTKLIRDKRVVLFDRSRAYASLFGDFEYALIGDRLPDGDLIPHHPEVLAPLGHSRWECARLNAAAFFGQWDAATGAYALPADPAEGRSGPARCTAVADLLRTMAAPTRYRDLDHAARETTAAGRSHRPRPLTGTRLSRSAAARQAVLERSLGACENPTCPNPRFTSDRSVNGDYLLEVDHVDDHARGGADIPEAMIALCPNCHTIKTRGTAGEQLREAFRKAALDRHRQFLGHA